MKITKIKLVAITAFAFSSLLMGCSEEIYDGAYKPSLESHYLSVYPRDFDFGNGEETKTGSITSENSWSFTGVPSWLSLSPSSGNSDAEFSVKSTVNEIMVNRTSVFYISANTSDWKQQKAITASQASALPSFSFVNLENTSIYLDATAQTRTFDVETNLVDLATKVTLTSGSDGWITATYNNKRLTITISANDDGYQRSGRVELWSSTYSKGGIIYISQYKPNLSFDEITSLSFNADGGSQTVKVSSDLAWSALSKESWIEVSPAHGASGDNQVKITALPSYQSGNRNGKVLFYYKDNQSAVGSIAISQTGRYLTVTPTSITLSAEENSSGSVNIDSNISWTIDSYPDWVSFNNKNGGAGKSTEILSATKNNSLNSRSGTIIFKDSKTGVLESRVAVTQNGLDFGDQTTLEFGWQASSFPLEVPFPNAWNAAISNGWVSLSQYSGNGSSNITVSVLRNDGEETRNATITFTSEGKKVDVKVVQVGQYIHIENSSSNISAKGGIIELNYSSTIGITPSVNYLSNGKDWLEYSAIDNGYTLSVASNTSSLDRTAEFVLTPLDRDVIDVWSNGIKFKVNQQGRKLTLDVSQINVFAKGGTTETYIIDADGKYTLSKGDTDTWYSIIHNSETNTFYLVVAENNTGSKRNGLVTIALLDLPTGEQKQISIPVLQASSGEIDIIIDDFKDPEIW